MSPYKVNWGNVAIFVLLFFTLFYLVLHVLAWIFGGHFPN